MRTLLLSALLASAHADDATWAPRTDAELDAALTATCEVAKAEGDLVLLEFSAPWCGDCQLLKKLKATPEVTAELEQFQNLIVDVGRFERHEALRKHFGVTAIAHWAVLAPTDCTQPVTAWPKQASGTLEPKHGKEGPRTAADVAGWLKAARSAE